MKRFMITRGGASVGFGCVFPSGRVAVERTKVGTEEPHVTDLHKTMTQWAAFAELHGLAFVSLELCDTFSQFRRCTLPDGHTGPHYFPELKSTTADQATDPIPVLLYCPECGDRHIDEGEFATKVHHTHACQTCGLTWRPAVVPTVGVRFLPGFKNEPESPLRRVARVGYDIVSYSDGDVLCRSTDTVTR